MHCRNREKKKPRQLPQSPKEAETTGESAFCRKADPSDTKSK